MSREELDTQNIRAELIVIARKVRITLAVKHHDNKVIDMDKGDILELIKYSKKAGIITQEQLDKL